MISVTVPAPMSQRWSFRANGWGIAIAAVLSIIAHLRHSYRPINVLLFLTPEKTHSEPRCGMQDAG